MFVCLYTTEIDTAHGGIYVYLILGGKTSKSRLMFDQAAADLSFAVTLHHIS